MKSTCSPDVRPTSVASLSEGAGVLFSSAAMIRSVCFRMAEGVAKLFYSKLRAAMRFPVWPFVRDMQFFMGTS